MASWRLVACVIAVAACVPYLGLKALWLAGATVGWNDPGQAESGTLMAGNAITVGMDAIAVAAVLALTFSWGLRLPAWLVLLPMWVATGLLAPIALGVPTGAAVSGATGSAVVPPGALAGWVYGLVYGGFSVQAVTLLAAFVLYAGVRWPDVFRCRLGDLGRGATWGLQQIIVNGSTVVVVAYAVMFVAWGFGVGLAPGQTFAATPAQRVAMLVVAALAVLGVAGMHLLVSPRPRVRRVSLWAPLGAAWVGAGALFASSLYRVVLLLVGAGETGIAPPAALVLLAATLAGLLLGSPV